MQTALPVIRQGARMGTDGRYLEMTRAVLPVSVREMMSLPQWTGRDLSWKYFYFRSGPSPGSCALEHGDDLAR